jgi:Rieske 2Fe-2S family protein
MRGEALVDNDISPASDRCEGFPGEAYTSGRVFSWEMRRFWKEGWVCVGRTSMLPERGDQTSVHVADTGILLVRDADGELRCYLNACRHRGHELVRLGCSVRRSTVWCAYHAWVYRLNGSLRNAPGFADAVVDELGLIKVRSATWGGWLFVNLSGTAVELADAVGNLDNELARYRPAELSVVASREYLVDANWKVIYENYLECYHCPSVHPELSRVQRTSGGENFVAQGLWSGGFLDLRNDAVSASLDGTGQDWNFPLLDDQQARSVRYHALLPNLFVTALHDYVLTHRLEPLAAGRTRIACEWLFAPDFLAEGRDSGYAVEFWEATNKQDWASCESVQRGVSSYGYRPGPLSPSETAVRDFIVRITTAYQQDRALADPRFVAGRG